MTEYQYIWLRNRIWKWTVRIVIFVLAGSFLVDYGTHEIAASALAYVAAWGCGGLVDHWV